MPFNRDPLNNQQQALRDFLALYAVTRDDGVKGNGIGWDDIAVRNDDVRKALFAGGGDNNAIIYNVVIGDDNKNRYAAMHTILKDLGIENLTRIFHESHFHINLRTPDLRPIDPPARNLLANSAVVDQTQMAASSDLTVTAQALLAEVQPHLNFAQGDLNMLVMDVPPDVPPQYAPIVVAQASQAKPRTTSVDRSMGVCQLIENIAGSEPTAKNTISPSSSVWIYFQRLEHQGISEADFKTAKVTLLQGPEHGELEDLGTSVLRHGVMVDTGIRSYAYRAKPDYYGPDHATLLVEIGGYKVKVLYFFKVLPGVGGGSDSGGPYNDKSLCPNGEYWRISFDENDPNAPIYTFESPTQLTSSLAGAVQANLTFADLAGDAVGQSGRVGT